MPTTDRDLLVLEPRVFTDTGWIGQRLFRSTTAVMLPGGVGITESNGPFSGLGIGVGSVLLISATPVEVTAVVSATQATISLLRASTADPAIPARALTGTITFECFTFAPQIESVRRRLLRGLGLAPGTTDGAGPIAEDRIVDDSALSECASLGALHLIFAAATPLVADPSGVSAKASSYAQRFAAARRALSVEIDLDGDGIADATRRVSLINLVRG